MITDNYNVEFYFNNQWNNVSVLMNNFIITEILHKKLSPADNNIQVTLEHNQTLFEQFKYLDKKDIPARIKKNNQIIFTGFLRHKFSYSRTQKLEPLKVELVEPSYILKKKIPQEIEYKNKTVYYIITDLLTKAGINSYNIASILTTIPYLLIEENKNTYHEIITKLLFEYGYVWYFDNNGYFVTYKLFNPNLSTTFVFDNSNTLTEILQNKTEEEYEKFIVSWKDLKTISNSLVFSDTTNAKSGYKCLIEIPPNKYYLDKEIIYAEPQNAEGKILYLENVNLDIIKDTGIEVYVCEPYKDKIKLSIKNTNNSVSKFIKKLDITAGSAIVLKEGENKSIVVNTTDTEKVYEYKSEYIYDKQSADNLVNFLANYYKYSDYTYNIKSKVDYPIGSIVTISDTLLGTNKGRIISKKTNVVSDIIDYEIEAINEYSASTITSETTIVYKQPQNVGGAYDSLVDSFSESAYYRLLTTANTVKIYPDGRITPSLVQFQSKKILGINEPVEYAGRFKIFIDDVESYFSAQPETILNWIGENILPQENLYPSDSLLPILQFYSSESDDTVSVRVELYDETGVVLLDKLTMLVLKDISFNQSKISQTIKSEIPKYLGKFLQQIPTQYNRGDWFLIYGNDDNPFQRGLYRVKQDLTFEKLSNDLNINGIYFLTALNDILSVVKDGYGELNIYGNITFIENLATNYLMTQYLLGVDAEFLGTIRGGGRFDKNGNVIDDTKQGYIIHPDGFIRAQNVDLSGALAVDYFYVEKGVFLHDRFYPEKFW